MPVVTAEEMRAQMCRMHGEVAAVRGSPLRSRARGYFVRQRPHDGRGHDQRGEEPARARGAGSGNHRARHRGRTRLRAPRVSADRH